LDLVDQTGMDFRNFPEKREITQLQINQKAEIRRNSREILQGEVNMDIAFGSPIRSKIL
jgi:hypothetical protein